MSKTLIIIQREFTTRVKKKSFILLTILTPFIFAALIVIPVWLATFKDEGQKEVVVVDKTGKYLSSLHNTADYTFRPSPADSASFYSEESNVEAVIVIGSDLTRDRHGVTIYSKKEVPSDLSSYVSSQLNEKVRHDKLAAAGIEGLDKIIDDVQSELDVRTFKRNAEGESTESNTFVAYGAGFLFTMLIYMFVLSYGGMVMQGVMEEKTNRIVELMVSSVKPFQLMMGKIVGIALVGLVQFLIWGIMLGIILGICTSVFGMTAGAPTMAGDPSMMTGAAAASSNMATSESAQIVAALSNLPFFEMAVMFLLYFVGGYLLYASFFAAIGASVNTQEDSSQFMMPVMLITIFGLYAAMYSIDNTNGPLAFWASLFPLTSPIVMMVRIPFGVPLWQELLSLALLYATSIAVVWLSGKIYRVGILMYGKKPSLKEMMKWIRYS